MTTADGKGLVLFLIQASASMARPVPACGGESALRLSLNLARSAIQKLQNLATRGRLVAAEWEVAVLSRGTNDHPPLRSLLPGTTPSRPAVALADAPLTGWADVPATGDAPSPVELLNAAAALTREWLAGRSRTLPPLVAICLDDDRVDHGYENPSRGLRHLFASAGSPELALCGFSAEVEATVRFPASNGLDLPLPWGSLREQVMLSTWGTSSALSLNDRSSNGLVECIRRIGRRHRPAALPGWRFASADAPRCDCRVLLAPKDGNSEHEWEDALAVEPGRGLAVVADGATQGIFARQWADILTRRWVADPPDADDPAGFEGWVSEARAEWRAGIDYDNLHGLSQDKVDEIGAGTAILALGLERTAAGHRWRAAAVGDVCLFWVRGGRLRMTFPATCSADFGSAPDLVRTLKVRNAAVRIMRAEGVGQLGDLYGLASDAVAQFLLRSHESGKTIDWDWDRLWEMDAQGWRTQLANWRASREIVNDDSTLVMLRAID